MDSEPKSIPGDDARTRFAAERTLLAWIRTGLALMGFGFVVARFGLFLREVALAAHETPPRSTGFSLWIGTALVLVGVAVSVLSALEHRRFLFHVEQGHGNIPPRFSLGIIIAWTLAAVGLAMVLYLLRLHL
jgi:putative membrane protein